MSNTRRKLAWRVLPVVVLGVIVVAGVWGFRTWKGRNHASAAAAERPPGHSAVAVNVIQPRLDSTFSMTVTQPAYVEPYYHLELRARVAGPILTVRKAINDPVVKGEELLTISVPDVAGEVFRKEAIVKQRERELEVAQAMRQKAEADVQIARSTVKEKWADVRTADATTVFRKQELERFRGLAEEDQAITGNIVAERRKFYEAAEAAGAGARATVEMAQANVLGVNAKLKEAIADEKLKEALIEVARRDVALSQELLKLATLTAPFDGVVTQRNVDPGTFVQNSAGSPGPGLLTIEKTDLVTISMHVPDTFAPYVDDKTEAILSMSELPGVEIQAQVSRFSPSLNTSSHDRTMRVEVDLFNRGPKSWAAFQERQSATHSRLTANIGDLLVAGLPGRAAAPWMMALQTDRLGKLAGEPQFADLKGGKMPIFPTVSDTLKATFGIKRLIPGMYGTMKLVLHNFRNAHLIPSQAVFTRGGKSYVYLVRSGVARLTPVEVQVYDGIYAKIAIIETQGKGTQRREPTPEDRIIESNQGELSDGQAVIPTLVKW